MCIVAIKPMGVKMPDSELIENMWISNSDGAGIMYNENGRVHIEKGFMKLTKFEARLKELGDLTDKTVVLHFRITTHGGTKPENCHPFPISEHVSVLQKRIINTDLGVAHNGIIMGVTPGKDISDTMEYIVSQLSYMKRIDRKFYKRQIWRDMIYNAIESKMAFLDGNGDFETIGEFNEYEGCFYSNYSYIPVTYFKRSTTSCAYPYDYDWFDDDYGTCAWGEEGEIAGADGISIRKGMELSQWAANNDATFTLLNRSTNKPIDNVFDWLWYVGANGMIYQYDADTDTCVIADDLVAYRDDTNEKVKYDPDLSEYIYVEIDE